MKSLVPRDQLVGERKSGHESSLLEPEDGGERSREEDSLDSGEGDESLSEGGLLGRDPLESPIGLSSNAGDWWNWKIRRVRMSSKRRNESRRAED